MADFSERSSGLIAPSAIPSDDERVAMLTEELVSLVESTSADRKMMLRQIEDLQWNLIGQSDRPDESLRSRAKNRQRALRYWQEDPVIGDAVDLLTRYTIGRGVPMPSIPEPPKPDPKLGDREGDGHFRGDPRDVEELETVKAKKEGTMTPAERRAFNQKKQKDAHERSERFADKMSESDADPLVEFIAEEEEHSKIGGWADEEWDNDEIIDPAEITEAQHERATEVMKRFWEAPENQAVLTSAQAQREKSTELQLDGEWFFLIYPGNEDEPTLLVDVDPMEISNIIPRNENGKVDVWYEREVFPLKYDYKTRTWTPDKDAKPKVTYYRHWRNAPDEGDSDPPEGLVEDEVYMYHVAINKVSRQKRGNSELKRVLEWAKGFSEYMESRMAVARAVNRVAQRVVIDGGPSEVARIAKAFQASDSLSLTRTPTVDPAIAAPEAKSLFTNPGVKVEPSNFETGSQIAVADKKAFLGQISAGTGWPMHYLGDEGAASLSTLTSMEMPLLKMVEDRQELWKQVLSDLSLIALRYGGVPVRPKVLMPEVLQRDISVFSASMVAVKQALDPTGQNVPLLRWMLEQILSAFGEREPSRLVDEIFPNDYVPPPPAPIAPGGEPGGGIDPPVPPPGVPNGNRATPYSGARSAQSARDAQAR